MHTGRARARERAHRSKKQPLPAIRKTIPKHFQVTVVTALTLAIATAIGLHARLLFEYPVAVGLDGYYYVLQVKGILAKGHLKYPYGAPLVFYAMAFMAKMTG